MSLLSPSSPFPVLGCSAEILLRTRNHQEAREWRRMRWCRERIRIKTLWQMSCLAGSAAQRLQSLQSCYLTHMGGPMLPPKIQAEFHSACFGLLALLNIVSGSHLISSKNRSVKRRKEKNYFYLMISFSLAWLRENSVRGQGSKLNPLMC